MLLKLELRTGRPGLLHPYQLMILKASGEVITPHFVSMLNFQIQLPAESTRKRKIKQSDPMNRQHRPSDDDQIHRLFRHPRIQRPQADIFRSTRISRRCFPAFALHL